MKVEKVEAGIRVLIIDKHLYDSLWVRCVTMVTLIFIS